MFCARVPSASASEMDCEENASAYNLVFNDVMRVLALGEELWPVEVKESYRKRNQWYKL